MRLINKAGLATTVIHVTSSVRAIAWLTVLDGKEPTEFDNDIDTGVKVCNRLNTFCCSDLSTFFHLMITCQHCNDRKIRLSYYWIYCSSLPSFYLKKKLDST